MTHFLARCIGPAILLLLAAGQSAAQDGERAHLEPAVCPGSGPEQGSLCTLEIRLRERVRDRGIAPAMALLDSLASDPTVRTFGHAFAHSIGITGFRGSEHLQEDFADCSPIFQAGCHHGVVQAYFASLPSGDSLSGEVIDGLCQRFRDPDGDRWMRFQCTHGLGHGLMQMASSQLGRALMTCDLLTDPWEREVCYSAVFMENIVQVTMPHHLPSAESGSGRDASRAADHPSHHHGSGTGGALHPAAVSLGDPVGGRFPPEDPLYPCTVVEGRYRSSCYQMQTSAILFFNDYDIAAAGGECLAAPDLFRTTCVQGLGRDLGTITAHDDAAAVARCRLVTPEYEPWCHMGYVKNVIDQSGEVQRGWGYCQLLDPGESKRLCNVAVGEQIWAIFADPVARNTACNDPQAEDPAACRHGAGLEAVPSSMNPLRPR